MYQAFAVYNLLAEHGHLGILSDMQLGMIMKEEVVSLGSMIRIHDDATNISKVLCMLHGSARQPPVAEAPVRSRLRVLHSCLCTLNTGSQIQNPR